MNITKEDWKIAELQLDEQKLFVVWAIHVSFCRTLADFELHFGSEWISEVIRELERDVFVYDHEGILCLTDAAVAAIADLGANEKSAFCVNEGDGSDELRKLDFMIGTLQQRRAELSTFLGSHADVGAEREVNVASSKRPVVAQIYTPAGDIVVADQKRLEVQPWNPDALPVDLRNELEKINRAVIDGFDLYDMDGNRITMDDPTSDEAIDGFGQLISVRTNGNVLIYHVSRANRETIETTR